jgi:hypothetical protein
MSSADDAMGGAVRLARTRHALPDDLLQAFAFSHGDQSFAAETDVITHAEDAAAASRKHGQR